MRDKILDMIEKEISNSKSELIQKFVLKLIRFKIKKL